MLNLLDVFRAWRRGKTVETQSAPESPKKVVAPTLMPDELAARRAKIRSFGRIGNPSKVFGDIFQLEDAIGEARSRQLAAGRSGRKVSFRVVAQIVGLGRSPQAQLRVRNLVAAADLGRFLPGRAAFVPS